MPKKTLKVAAVQMRVDQDIEHNAARAVKKLKELASGGVEVAAFQEGFLYGYTSSPMFWRKLDPNRLIAAETRIIRACKRYGIATVFGTAHMEGTTRFNSLLIVDRDGIVQGRYGKIHLAGEKWCEPSQHLPIYTICGVPCCFIICHDVRYPELVRLPAAAGAKVCFFCSCESTIESEHKLSAYRAMPISRATENSIYLVMTNAPAHVDDLRSASSSHGESKVIHPEGNVLSEAGFFSEEDVVCDLDLSLATGRVACRAVDDRTSLREWMQEGLKLVEQPVAPKANGQVRRRRKTAVGV